MIDLKSPLSPYSPLDYITVLTPGTGRLSIRDGLGCEYLNIPAQAEVHFQVSGAPGAQGIYHTDANGKIEDTLAIEVKAETHIDDEGGAYKALFDDLFYTLITTFGGRQHRRINGKLYQHFVSWLRDHTHTLKGMKWFENNLKTGFELYAERQQPNGMIWDRCYSRGESQTWRDYTFRHGGFISEPEDGTGFERIPIENDVEWLYIQCLYFTWQASGDDAWMVSWLDSALKALNYSLTDPYRWSDEYELLKRGYTIDTWDFQSEYDTQNTVDENGICLGNNVILLGKSKFGIFHGDNTGMTDSCAKLATMLATAGREDEAEKVRQTGEALQKRLDALSWNGDFYKHWVEESPQANRDFGVDEDSQVTLSNAYALNRQITHEQARAIIETYQRIREEMPESSAGEWYNCYPPFEKGFQRDNNKWDYMNGGVCSITAGELAHGAFHHGYETYACDILQRLYKQAEAHGGRLPVVLKGALEPDPTPEYTPLDLSEYANVDTVGDREDSPIGWSQDGPNDLRNLPTGIQEFGHVIYQITDPSQNGRRSIIGISRNRPYLHKVTVDVHRTAKSIWLLHTLIGNGHAGTLILHYADGTEHKVLLQSGQQLEGWFMPADVAPANTSEGSKNQKPYRLAWRGENKIFKNVGVWHWGHNHPEPEKEIASITCEAPLAGDAIWMIAGITLSDHGVYWPQNDVSYGIPNNWGAAAVVYALIEGLAGIKDRDRKLNTIELAPRWAASNTRKVEVCAHYPESNQYCAYHYEINANELHMQIAASGSTYLASVLLPENFEPSELIIDDEPAGIEITTIESSRYLKLPLSGLHAHHVRIC